MLSQVHLAKAQEMAEDLIESEGLEVEYLSIAEIVSEYAYEEGLNEDDQVDLGNLVDTLIKGAWYSEVNLPPVSTTYKKVRKARGN